MKRNNGKFCDWIQKATKPNQLITDTENDIQYFIPSWIAEQAKDLNAVF